MTSFEQGECMGCGQPCIGFYSYPCTCQQRGFSFSNGTCINYTFGDEKLVTCCECESPLNGGFCLFCNSRAGNSSAYDPNSNSYNDSPNFFDYTPQPQYDTYSCELCGNDAHYGYDCPPQVPFVYNPDPCFNQNFNYFPQTSPNFQCDQLIFNEPYCENYEGPHMTFQCQPMNYYEPNPCYDSNYSGFDQIEPPQFPVIHQPPREMSIQDMEDLKQQYLDEMKTLINEKDYRNGRIDIEIKINELKGNFNEMSIEINKKKKLHDGNSSSSDIAKLTHAVNQQTSVVTHPL
ncbi:hypothetical protein Tco_1212476 [Tanacetum coccineum]